MTNNQPDPETRRRLDTLLSMHIDEGLDQTDMEELEFLLRDDPTNRAFYLQYMDLQAALPAAISSASIEHAVASEQDSDWIAALVEYSELQRESSRMVNGSSRASRTPWLITFASLAATCLFAVAFYATRSSSVAVDSAAKTQLEQIQRDLSIQPSEVILTQAAGAELFGEFLPPVGRQLEFSHEYALTSGMIGLRFPAGAEVILEAPSVIEIAGHDRLIVSVGRCSVHAPPGAEGFEVVTPQTEIVDLGTRFSVSVSDVGATDVQVIEGLAEVRTRQAVATDPVLLAQRQARRFSDDAESGPHSLEFDASSYRKTLPDRVVSYRAKPAGEGCVAELQSVTVQRDGREVTIPVSDMIGVKVTHFRGTDIAGMAVQVGYEVDRLAGLETDALLYTGMLNPGGSIEPLVDDPVLAGPGVADQATPGLAVQFRTPVVNQPGPDVVFFELQSVVNPPQGDAFHVSPLRFSEGLRSLSIRNYDVAMTSPEAQRLPEFQPYFFREPPSSLEELMTAAVDQRRPSLRFRALATGIDLSDLGYTDGAAVDGLFFQDAMNDDHVVDPVFIAGLPTDEIEETRP
ncbi:FecR protein domain protein [Rhodopirellula maiorica SM1]|uniref:FecR protein domain protein n=1 Tax=Rhodopirellula maiorica SM1 TaxID=1265738 RepID=M5S5L1_9BACT|nr:FecR domain-containing protein [Rhodopirellula maiorica]EMI22942.1 FecR protein domain protein [Rhodopirellula maiorica SM1]